MMKTKEKKKPWPTKDAMEQVYEMKLWGGAGHEFYSGAGSHDVDLVNPYIEVVLLFLKSFQSAITVCDFGCGDFNIGKEFVQYTKQYIGVDIVENLIAYNRETFISENLEFRCLNIAEDNLPLADCAIVRQVLQHISNSEVLSVVSKLSKFKYVILTEHIPSGDFVPNKDIISGQGIRLKKKSGLNLLAAPFHFQVKEEKQLLTVDLGGSNGKIITILYTLF